ncbi:MAG TPA: shikimate dehydrogenase [Longimicrobiales bacterium]
MPEITAVTRLYALLGDPVSHSLSPRMQNAAFASAGLDAIYVALRCSTDDVPGLLRALARAGGGGNVTVPHKGVAAAAVDDPTPAVIRTGACNTFWLEDGRIRGDNTDVAGFLATVRRLVPPLKGGRALLLGAGGAARAVVAALLDDGVAEIAVRNRSRVRAEALIASFNDGAEPLRLAPDDQTLRRERFDLVVNATSLGLHEGDESPLDLSGFSHVGAALDLVYLPGETAWVRSARALGIPAADGLHMLVGQGAAAFERWFGQPAPVEAMRTAVTR